MNSGTLPTWSDFARREQCAAPERWDRLVALYAPVLGPTGGTLFDVGGRKLTGTPANTVWAPGPGGWRLGFNGTSSVVSVADSTPFVLQPPFSVVLVSRPQSGIAQYDCAISCSEDSGKGWRLWTRDASNYKWYWEANDGGAKNVAGLAAIGTTRREVVVGVHDGANLVLYVNGGLQGATACGAVSYAFSPSLNVGNQSGTSRFFPMNLELAAVFSRAIRQPEAAEWFADPFALLRPAEEDVGAGIDLAHLYAIRQRELLAGAA